VVTLIRSRVPPRGCALTLVLSLCAHRGKNSVLPTLFTLQLLQASQGESNAMDETADYTDRLISTIYYLISHKHRFSLIHETINIFVHFKTAYIKRYNYSCITIRH
jgi:hypothetical protein